MVVNWRRGKLIYLGVALLICTNSFAQSFEVHYSFTVNNYFANKQFSFNSVVYYSSEKDEKLYKVSLGITNQNSSTIDSNVAGMPMINSKKLFQYLQYSSEGKTMLINDIINEKQYFLEDNVPKMQWVFSNDKKEIKGVILNKAYGTFRGRDYIVWYNPNFPYEISPWKFNNLKGLIYEIIDSNNEFTWKLSSIEKVDYKIENPFLEVMGKFQSYTDYPKLRYGLSERLKESLSKIQGNQMFEQPRNDLETKFEWEN